MRSRTDGMWWGTAIEAPDPSGLARFYSELLGWPIGHEEPGTAILAAPQGSVYIVFQQAPGYQPPRRRGTASDDASKGAGRCDDRWVGHGVPPRQHRHRTDSGLG